jgi:hypothetical protein
MGLMETVRRNLAMIDVDTAASQGADAALRHGFDAGRIAAAMAMPSADVRPGAISLIACGASNSKANGKGNGNERRAGWQGPKGENGGWRKRGGRRPSGGGGCNGLPPGRYASVTATTQVPSLFGPQRDPTVSAVAIVRLP